MSEFEGKTIADKYRVDSLLHESDLGGFYRGWHVLMDKAVVIKVLAIALAVDRRLEDRFITEAKAQSRINNANVLAIQDFGTDQHGVTYAVYEDIGGPVLREL